MKQFQPLSNATQTQILTAIVVYISRLNVLPANVSPLGSFGFFGNPWLYLSMIIAFDVFVKGIYPGFWLTYIGFVAYPALGWIARRKQLNQYLLLPLASFLFFLLSNFGVWLYWYDHTWTKLIVCYTAALPFYTRTLLSDMLFGYGYLLLKKIKELDYVQRLSRTCTSISS